VLACCSIQNARLLLASNRRATAGLGNAHDLVGRFFMEHLEMPGGHLVMPEMRAAKTAMYVLQFGRTKARGELSLGAALQRQHRILNSTASLTPAAPGQVAKSTFQTFTPEVLDAFMRAQKGDTSGFPILRRTLADPNAPLPDPRFFNLITRQEQAPNPNSRITLARDRDAMGMLRVRLDWRLTDLDRRTFRAFYEALGTELGRSGLGRVQLLDWVVASDGAWPSFLSGGWHHMGTTRMHADPKHGVVDADCRVHGLANLSVAGAAVFPTAGAANPTLTLVAMSLRLSDHLKTKLA
jgi:choline dehydrogenase-like flavoprotein